MPDKEGIMAEESKIMLCCDGCGRAPRVCNGTTVPLKRCARCGQAYYHDADCQRKHYKTHKKFCPVMAHENALLQRHFPDISIQEKEESIVRIQKRADGEMGVFATRDIAAGHSMRYKPLAPPILFANFRRSHCALCFQEVRSLDAASCGCDDPRYIVLFCSDDCANTCEEWVLEEVASIKALLDQDPNMKVLPMALQVFRLLRFADWTEVLSMQSHPIVEDDALLERVYRLGYGSKAMVDAFLEEYPENGTELLQRQCVLLTVMRLLALNAEAWQCWRQRNGAPAVERETLISEFLQRIKYNAFTMTMDDHGPGFAMFAKPSYRMNHSCAANARLRYVWQTGHFPELVLDVTQPVRAEAELCISYVDVEDVSLAERRNNLAQKYRFHCQCPLCRAEEEQLV